MKSIHEIMRERLYHTKGLPMYDIEDLRQTEWDSIFEGFMRRRLLMGGLRYGLIGAEGKRPYNRVKDMIKRLQKYNSDRNAEHLVDVANLCMCEYREGKNVVIAIDDGEHTT